MTIEEEVRLQHIIDLLVNLSTEYGRRLAAAERVFRQHSPDLFEQYRREILPKEGESTLDGLAILQALRSKLIH